MSSASPPSDRWVAAGLEVLAADGAAALRVERLARAVGLTKGSFYHHFDGMDAYRGALLSACVRDGTDRYVREVGARVDLDARGRMELLLELVVADEERDRALEVALREWARHDPAVDAVQRRIDAARRGFVRDLAAEAGLGGTRAADLADGVVGLLVGAQHLVPALPVSTVARLLRGMVDDALGRSR